MRADTYRNYLWDFGGSYDSWDFEDAYDYSPPPGPKPVIHVVHLPKVQRYFSTREAAERFAGRFLVKPEITTDRIDISSPRNTTYGVWITFRSKPRVARLGYAKDMHEHIRVSKSHIIVTPNTRLLGSPRPYLVDYYTEVRKPTPQAAELAAWDALNNQIKAKTVLPVHNPDYDTPHAWGTLSEQYIVEYTDAQGIPLDPMYYISA